MNVHSGGSEAAPSTLGGIWKGCREVAGPLDFFMGVCPMDSTALNQAPYFANPAEVKEPQEGNGDAGSPQTAVCQWEPQLKAFGEPTGMSCVPERWPFPLLQGAGGGEDH